MKTKMAIKPLANENGVVLVVALLLIAVLAILGTTAVFNSTTDLKISSNYKTNNEAFYIAEAGAERARGLLRSNVVSGSSISDLLAAEVGTNGVLSDSHTFTNFYANGAWVTDDLPYINDTNFGVGHYRVYLTNGGSTDSVTSTTDTDKEVTLTSVGFGLQNSMAVVQITVRKILPPNLPGAIVLPGPDVNFAGGDSSAQVIAGVTEPAVAVNSTLAKSSVIAGIPKPDSYIGNCPSVPCVENESSFGSPWDSITDQKALVSSLASISDFKSTSAPGFTWGTASNPKVVYINGDVSIGPETGAGIIICTGNLSISGKFSYDGLILAIGKGNITRFGGGSGQINGSVFVSNIAGTDGILNTGDDAFGVPTYDTSGGGTSDITYNSTSLATAAKLAPFIKTSWKQSGLD